MSDVSCAKARHKTAPKDRTMALRLTFPQVSGYFANSATHSTCMVIGKTRTLLSVNAIL